MFYMHSQSNNLIHQNLKIDISIILFIKMVFIYGHKMKTIHQLKGSLLIF